jgi:hypothetical protein
MCSRGSTFTCRVTDRATHGVHGYWGSPRCAR